MTDSKAIVALRAAEDWLSAGYSLALEVVEIKFPVRRTQGGCVTVGFIAEWDKDAKRRM